MHYCPRAFSRVCYWMHRRISACGNSRCSENAAGGPVVGNCSLWRRHGAGSNWFDVIFRALLVRCTWKVSSAVLGRYHMWNKGHRTPTCRVPVWEFSIITIMIITYIAFWPFVVVVRRFMWEWNNFEWMHSVKWLLMLRVWSVFACVNKPKLIVDSAW